MSLREKKALLYLASIIAIVGGLILSYLTFSNLQDDYYGILLVFYLIAIIEGVALLKYPYKHSIIGILLILESFIVLYFYNASSDIFLRFYLSDVRLWLILIAILGPLLISGIISVIYKPAVTVGKKKLKN